MKSDLYKGIFVQLRKVSSHVSRRNLRRLTWAETLCYLEIFCMSEDHSILLFSKWLDKLDPVDPLLSNVLVGTGQLEDAFSPLLPEHGSVS